MAGPDSSVKCRQVGETKYETYAWDINFYPMSDEDGNYVRNEFGDVLYAPQEPQTGPNALNEASKYDGIPSEIIGGFVFSGGKNKVEELRSDYIACFQDEYTALGGRVSKSDAREIVDRCLSEYPMVYSTRRDRKVPSLWGDLKSGETQYVVLADMKISCENVYEKAEASFDDVPMQEVNTFMLSAKEFHAVGLFLQELAALDGDPKSVSRDDIDIYGTTPLHRVWKEGDYLFSNGSPNYRIRVKELVKRAVSFTMGLDPESDRALISLLVNAPEEKTFSSYVLFENLNYFLRAYEANADSLHVDSQDVVVFDSIESTHPWTRSVDGLIDAVHIQKTAPAVAGTKASLGDFFSAWFSD